MNWRPAAGRGSSRPAARPTGAFSPQSMATRIDRALPAARLAIIISFLLISIANEEEMATFR